MKKLFFLLLILVVIVFTSTSTVYAQLPSSQCTATEKAQCTKFNASCSVVNSVAICKGVGGATFPADGNTSGFSQQPTGNDREGDTCSVDSYCNYGTQFSSYTCCAIPNSSVSRCLQTSECLRIQDQERDSQTLADQLPDPVFSVCTTEQAQQKSCEQNERCMVRRTGDGTTVPDALFCEPNSSTNSSTNNSNSGGDGFNVGGGNSFTPGSDSADNTPGQTLINPLNAGSIPELLAIVLRGLVQIGSILLVLALVWVGFLFVFAQGKAEKVSEARKALMWVVIGGLVLLGSSGIAELIQATVSKL